MILFVSGEERGLLGSKHYVENPTVPISQIVCDLNIDMVGRNDSKEMHVYGNASSPDLDAAHQAAMKVSGLKFTAKTGSIFRRSDQYNFYLKDIPCLFWTSGLHKDYHSTKDEAKRIDTSKVSRAAKHAYSTAWRVANTTERPSGVNVGEVSGASAVVNRIIAPRSSSVTHTSRFAPESVPSTARVPSGDSLKPRYGPGVMSITSWLPSRSTRTSRLASSSSARSAPGRYTSVPSFVTRTCPAPVLKIPPPGY